MSNETRFNLAARFEAESNWKPDIDEVARHRCDDKKKIKAELTSSVSSCQTTSSDSSRTGERVTAKTTMFSSSAVSSLPCWVWAFANFFTIAGSSTSILISISLILLCFEQSRTNVNNGNCLRRFLLRFANLCNETSTRRRKSRFVYLFANKNNFGILIFFYENKRKLGGLRLQGTG